jgi:hypothetical protein
MGTLYFCLLAMGIVRFLMASKSTGKLISISHCSVLVFKVREEGRNVAYGVNTEGYREVLGLMVEIVNQWSVGVSFLLAERSRLARRRTHCVRLTWRTRTSHSNPLFSNRANK